MDKMFGAVTSITSADLTLPKYYEEGIYTKKQRLLPRVNGRVLYYENNKVTYINSDGYIEECSLETAKQLWYLWGYVFLGGEYFVMPLYTVPIFADEDSSSDFDLEKDFTYFINNTSGWNTYIQFERAKNLYVKALKERNDREIKVNFEKVLKLYLHPGMQVEDILEFANNKDLFLSVLTNSDHIRVIRAIEHAIPAIDKPDFFGGTSAKSFDGVRISVHGHKDIFTIEFLKKNFNVILEYILNDLESRRSFKKYGVPINILQLTKYTYIEKHKEAVFTFELKKELREMKE